MNARECWKLGLLNVFSAPLRSCLTVLGMAIGIGAILAVLTLGDAGQIQVQSEMKRLGIDKVWITTDGTLQQGDAQRLQNTLGMNASEQIYLPLQVTNGDQSVDTIGVGCTLDYLKMIGAYAISGELFFPLDFYSDSKSVMIGAELARVLDIGANDELIVEGRYYRVRSVIAAGGSFERIEGETAVYMPLAAVCRLTGGTVHEIVLDVPSGQKPEYIASAARQLLERQRSTEVDALTMQVQIDAANSVVQTFIQVLKWVAIICMLVGGVGVMNILLVGVRERRREIGIMQSMGTTGGQICCLFLLEALIYAAIGGFLGILLGMGLTDAAGRSIGLHPQISLFDCAAVLMVAFLTGLGFGVAPAARASGMKPVDALRRP